MSMSNLSVKARLTMTLSLLALAMFCVGLLGLNALKQANTGMNDMYANQFQSAAAVNKIAALRRDNVRALDVALMNSDAAMLAEYRAIQERNNKIIDELWSQYKTLPADQEESALAEEFHEQGEKYRSWRTR
jgi:hypothetical protein